MSDAGNIIYATAVRRDQSERLPGILSGRARILDVTAIPQNSPKAVEYRIEVEPAELGAVLHHLRAAGFGLLGTVH